MSFPRYERYKDSGVEWLGEVPEGWEVTRTKHVIEFQIGWTPPTGNDDSYVGENLWANISDLGPKWIFDTAKYISDKAVETSRIKLSPKGSLLFSFKLSIGQVSFAGTEMYTNEAIATFLPNDAISAGYAYYSFPLFITQNASENIYGAKLLNQELIRAATLLLPSLSEQHAIASFLDREIGKVDDLMTEQERLIELLKEKRQAVISHAVTKGLNPDVSMKDSGVEWLGEVPEGWEIMPLKRDIVFLTSGSRGWAEYYADDGAIFIRIGNLTRDNICLDLTDTQRVTVPDGTEGERTKVQAGDILFSITAYLGSVAVVPDDLETSYVSQHVALARLGRKYLQPKWVAYVALSFVGKTYLETQGYGGTKIQLSLDDVANLIMSVPPRKEQSAIVAFLDTESAKIDSFITEAQKAIDLLKERRSALISAVVTGKIDVRCS